MESNRRLFIKNTIFGAGLTILTQLIAIFIIPLFVRNLGAELYGIWVLSFVVLGYLGFIDFGFISGIMKYISESYAKKDIPKLNKVINTGILLLFGIGLCISVIMVFFNKQIMQIFNVRPENVQTARNLLIITGLFSLILWPVKITNIVFRGVLRFKELSILEGIRSFFSTLTMLFCIYKGMNILNIAIIYNIARFILWIPAIIVLVKVIPEISFGVKYLELKILKEMAPFSLGFFYAHLLMMAQIELDKLIIGIAMSMTAVTAYVIVSKLKYVISRNVGVLVNALFPTIFTANAAGNNKLIENMTIKLTRYRAMAVSPLGYLGILVSPVFIKLWMGQDYVQFAIWAQIFMLIFLIGPGLGTPILVMMGIGKLKTVNIIRTFQVVLNILISVLLVKKYGIGGPILGTIISIALLTVFFFPFFCKILNIKWFNIFIDVNKVVLINLPVFGLFYWLIHKLTITSWTGLIMFSFIVVLIQYLTLYHFIFTSDDKKDVKIMFETIGLSKSI